MLSFASTLGRRAKLTMLDEPSEGVQPENIERMAALVNRRKADGDSFIIVEQNLELVAVIADSVIVLDHREVVLEGSYAELGRERIEQHLAV